MRGCRTYGEYEGLVGAAIEDMHTKEARQKLARCEEVRRTKGDAQAQNNLGIMWHFGEGGDQSFAKAKGWLEKSAGQGHKGALKALKELGPLEIFTDQNDKKVHKKKKEEEKKMSMSRADMGVPLSDFS